nr:unnamed protein product [Rangifer tarandus platyrhynchus]
MGGGGQKREKELSHPQRGEGTRRSAKVRSPGRRVTPRPRPRLPWVPGAGRRSWGVSRGLRGSLSPRDPPPARRQIPPRDPRAARVETHARARGQPRQRAPGARRASAQLPRPPPAPPPAPAPRSPGGGRGTHLRGGGRSPGRKRERRAEFVARLRLPGRGQAERAAAAGAAGAPGDSARRAPSALGSGSRARPEPVLPRAPRPGDLPAGASVPGVRTYARPGGGGEPGIPPGAGRGVKAAIESLRRPEEPPGEAAAPAARSEAAENVRLAPSAPGLGRLLPRVQEAPPPPPTPPSCSRPGLGTPAKKVLGTGEPGPPGGPCGKSAVSFPAHVPGHLVRAAPSRTLGRSGEAFA